MNWEPTSSATYDSNQECSLCISEPIGKDVICIKYLWVKTHFVEPKIQITPVSLFHCDGVLLRKLFERKRFMIEVLEDVGVPCNPD